MQITPRPGGQAAIRKIVMHLNVGPEIEGGAQSLADYLKTVPAGYHEIVDDRTFVQCAQPDQIVWGASGMNDAGYHICVIGNIQTAQQWHDAYSNGELAIAELRCAARCHDFNIPPVLLTDAQVADPNARGICDHWAVNRAIVKHAVALGDMSMGPGDHTDVGPGFPWVEFIGGVSKDFNPAAPPMTPQKVRPDYMPAINLPGIVSSMKAPDGAWLLGEDGGVFGFPVGIPIYGSPHGQPLSPGEVWSQIRAPKPGEGQHYTCVTSAGDLYRY